MTNPLIEKLRQKIEIAVGAGAITLRHLGRSEKEIGKDVFSFSVSVRADDLLDLIKLAEKK
jgi:hypothetical protein